MKVDPMDVESYYFPVKLSQVEDLVGKMLTHIEAMNLPDEVTRANKSLIKQSIYRWWEFAQENSLTSWNGCIGPIREKPTLPEEERYVWYTDAGKILPAKFSAEQYAK